MQGPLCYEQMENEREVAAFVEKYSPLIHKIARYIKSTIPQNVDFDDLLQSGLVGLLEARSTFKEDAGASFATYATLKIRYAIYEGIRKNSGITREISQNIKKITTVMRYVEQNGKHHPSAQNIADEMGVSLKQYAEITKQIHIYRSINMHENDLLDEAQSQQEDNPLNLLEIETAKSSIKTLISELPKREQVILALYYNEQLSFKEIASIVDLTEARISQLHTSIIGKLKRKIENKKEVLL